MQYRARTDPNIKLRSTHYTQGRPPDRTRTAQHVISTATRERVYDRDERARRQRDPTYFLRDTSCTYAPSAHAPHSPPEVT